jgi:Protein of unknown function (DUF3224)
MSAHAEGSFKVSSWDEHTYVDLDGESKLTKVSFVQEYTGGLEATGSWDGQMFYAEDGTAFYTGLQHFVGTLDGRKGGFVLEAKGRYDAGEASAEWLVVTGSGAGDLSGISGTGFSSIGSSGEGTYTFDYDID